MINGAAPFMAEADQLNLTALTEGVVASSLLLGARSARFSEGDCRTVTADVKISLSLPFCSL